MGLQDHSLNAILLRELLLDLLRFLMIKSRADRHPVDLPIGGLNRLHPHREIPLFYLLSKGSCIIFITEGSCLNEIGRGVTGRR